MKKKSTKFLIFFFMILLLLDSSPLYAENVIFFKGRGIDELANLIVMPNGVVVSTLEIQISCWSPGLIDDDYYIYTPSSKNCSPYNYSSILSPPDLNDLDVVLNKKPLVVYDTIMGTLVPIDDWSAGVPDSCPNDPAKVVPGLCGCSIADDDTDQDGIPDCNDFSSDTNDDWDDTSNYIDNDDDGDGTLNYIDDCPNDPGKVVPGLCGCGVSDVLNDCGTCGPTPTEISDYIDNDCDGQIDENDQSHEGFWLMILPAILNSANKSS